MSDTPRTDVIEESYYGLDVGIGAFSCMCTHAKQLETELTTANQRIEELKQIIERDRSHAHEICLNLRGVLSSIEWLREGRGSYEYHDDRWISEFGSAIDDIYKAIEPLKDISHDLSDSPRDRESIEKARAPHLAERIERMEEWKDKYFELLYQVETKHPGETRHETALRYIRQAETSSDRCEQGQQALQSEVDDETNRS